MKAFTFVLIVLVSYVLLLHYAYQYGKYMNYSKTETNSTVCVQINSVREKWDDTPTTMMLLEEGIQSIKSCSFYSFMEANECVVNSGIDKWSLARGVYKEVTCPVELVTILERKN